MRRLRSLCTVAALLLLAPPGLAEPEVGALRKQTQSVNLPEPVTVVLLYWTIEVRSDGSVHFKRDPYDRDHPVLEALEGDFEFQGRPGLERL
jgi:murein L,D-transpeptidase YcbB/YkuD